MQTLSLVLELARAVQADDPFAFRLGPQEYLLRREGGGFSSSRLAWDEALLRELTAVRAPDRDPALLARLGGLLRRFLLPLGWPEQEARIQAALDAGCRVALSLRLAAAELYALPWELLTFKETGQHLGELTNLLVRYEWPGTATVPDGSQGPTRPEGGRILLAWSAAGGAVPLTEHLTAILRACRAGSHPFDPEQDVLPHVSCASLAAALGAAKRDERPIAVLHLLCHGAASGSTFGIALNEGAREGSSVIVDGGRLRQLLAPYADTLRLVVLSACDSGNTGALGNQLGSIAQTLHRAGFAAVVASRYPLSVSGSIRLTAALYQELIEAPASLETALLTARRRLAESTTQIDWASLQLYARSADGEDTRPVVFRPYRGLLAFQPEHRRFFFGREREIGEVSSDLRALGSSGRPRFLVVAGASGSGKSSLVLAGAVPELLAARESGAAPRLVRLRPGDEGGLAALEQSPGSAQAPVLLVVDQLEEIFTHVAEAAAQKEWMRRLFRLASDRGGGVAVLATLRVDFLGRCGEIVLDEAGLRLDSLVYNEAHRVFVAQMKPEQLETTILAPARRVGLRLEDGLVSRLLRDVGDEPGALPLLEYTLDLLWQQRQGRTLTQASYDAVGGLVGALHGRADALFAALDRDEQATARRIFVRLVRVADEPAQGTRRRVAVEKLRPRSEPGAARFDRVLAVLVGARLVVQDGDGAARTVEIAHEALIRRWPRLIDWVREDRELLLALEKLEQWVRERAEHGTLLVGEQLLYAEALAGDPRADCSQAARALVTESQARRRARKRVQKGVAALLVLATAVSSSFAWYGFKSSQQARSAQRKAEAAEQSERAGKELLRQKLLAGYLERGRQLLVEQRDAAGALAWLHRAHNEGLDTPALRLLLQAAYSELDSLRLTLPGQSPQWSADGRSLLTESGQEIRLWALPGGQLVRSFVGSAPRLSPDGSRLLLHSPDEKTASIVDVKSGELLFRLADPALTVGRASWSADGSRLVSVGATGDTVVIWSGQDGRLLRKLPPPPELEDIVGEYSHGYEQVRFSQDGRRLASDGGPGPITIWDAISGELLHSSAVRRTLYSFNPRSGRFLMRGTNLMNPSGVSVYEPMRKASLMSEEGDSLFRDAAMSDDGELVATLSAARGIRLWSLRAQGLRSSLTGHWSEAEQLLFSPDGGCLAVSSRERAVFLWDTKSSHLAQTLLDAGTPAAFRPDGKQLATSWGDGAVRIFDTSLQSPLPGLPSPVRRGLPTPQGSPARSGHSPVRALKLRVPAGEGTTREGVVEILDAASNKILRALEHREVTEKLEATFAFDGAFVVTWSSPELGMSADAERKRVLATTAKVWDAQSGALLLALQAEAAQALIDSFGPPAQRPLDASGAAWELRPIAPDAAKLSAFLRCRVPLRFAGELLLPSATSDPGAPSQQASCPPQADSSAKPQDRTP